MNDARQARLSRSLQSVASRGRFRDHHIVQLLNFRSWGLRRRIVAAMDGTRAGRPLAADSLYPLWLMGSGRAGCSSQVVDFIAFSVPRRKTACRELVEEVTSFGEAKSTSSELRVFESSCCL